ncbi:MazG nucleotide pyrophosphohydrolase domain-containing protein [Wukongibacter baidiensis]|uniref:MazG nucleotide pyrophosphohydrolase domain-containing protein n=1 Tax=Wukongibacter baidiensis TaxID=1723361 RepID=UPI003D7F4EB5
MELIEIQKKIEKFTNEKNLNISPNVRIIDLVSEVGEMAKEILKATDYGKKNFIANEDWQEEMGDVLFSLICLANSTDINLEESLYKVLKKYEERFNIKGDIGSD